MHTKSLTCDHKRFWLWVVRCEIDKRFRRFETAFQNALGVKTFQGQEILSGSTCQNVSATKEFKFVCSKIFKNVEVLFSILFLGVLSHVYTVAWRKCKTSED